MEDNGELWLFITIARQFHHGMMDKVLDNGDKSDSFPVTNGVKQGCFLAPTLFRIDGKRPNVNVQRCDY